MLGSVPGMHGVEHSLASSYPIASSWSKFQLRIKNELSFDQQQHSKKNGAVVTCSLVAMRNLLWHPGDEERR